MKMLKNLLVLQAVFFLSASLFSCAGNVSSSSSAIQQYTLSFNVNGGSAVSAITRDEGSQVAKPTDPTKADNIFDGWYLDSGLSSSVSWPITLTANIEVFAKWMENRDYFLAARDTTFNSSQFEYDFNLSVDLAYGSLDGPSAIIDGNVKYNSQATNSYYKIEQNTGLLLADGTIHTIKTGTELAKFKVSSAGKLYSYEKEVVPADFKYESSAYAKVLFTFEREQIQTVSLSLNGKYEINYNGSFTGLVNSAISALDNPILQRFLDLPNSDSSLHVYVTFENGHIHTFEYEFVVEVTGATITFHYDLDVTKVGSGVTITAPSFSGVSISTEDIASRLSTINGAIDSYKSLAHSGYTYDVQTEVDFPGANSIGAHVQGRTMRQVSGSNAFFWNRIELDSDYKNNDLYNEEGVVDYERYRVKYANGDVYDVIDGVFSNTYTKIAGYNNGAIDNYYMLLSSSLLSSSNVSIIQQSSSGSVVTYSIGLNVVGIVSLLSLIDSSIRVHLNDSNEIVIYDIASGLEIKGCDFEIAVNNGALVSINIGLKGSYVANPYVGTEFTGACRFSLDYVLETNTQGNSYAPPIQNSEVDLSNS